MSYCHSGFPILRDTSFANGLSSNQTRLETAATGVIKRHSPTSIWSPRPTPTSNALFPVIASHWGPTRANDIMSRIAIPRSGPRRIAKRNNSKSIINFGRGGRENDPNTPMTAMRAVAFKAPPVRVPRRQASLGNKILASDHNSNNGGDDDDATDPARKIWTEMRRTSSGRPPSSSLHVSRVRRMPAGPDPVTPEKAATASSGPNNEVERRRQQIRDMALRNKRSIGADSLRSLVPSLAGFHLDGHGESGDGVTKEQQGGTRLNEHKNEGRWNLSAWW